MLEVHPAPDGFTVYDTDAGEAVIKFASRAGRDQIARATAWPASAECASLCRE